MVLHIIIPALKSMSQKDHEFEVSLDCTATPFLKKKKKKKT
jgi:hypothetical protein